MRRETGASEPADPAPPEGAGTLESSTGDALGETAPEDDQDVDRQEAGVDSNPRSSSPMDEGSDRSNIGQDGRTPLRESGDPPSSPQAGGRSGAETGFVDPEGRGNPPVSGEDGSTRVRADGGADPEAGRLNPRQPAMPADAVASEAGADSGRGMVASAAVVSATPAVRSAGDRRSVAGIDVDGATRGANPAGMSRGDGAGTKAIPDGMRVLEPAMDHEFDPRSPRSANGEKPAQPRGASAVVRAAEMNTELRNARTDGDSTHAPKPLNGQGSTSVTAVASAVAATSASPGPDAQSLPNGPASVAPMDGGTDSGRTIGGVARGLQALSSQRGGTLVMRLDPGNLGQVRMEMSLEAGRVQVVIAAAGDAARGLLRENLGVLRHALEDRGFAVERLTVESTARTTTDSSGPRGDSRGDGQDARGGQGSSDRQDASDERSRGRRDDAAHRRTERGRSDSDRFQEVLAGSGETSTA